MYDKYSSRVGGARLKKEDVVFPYKHALQFDTIVATK